MFPRLENFLAAIAITAIAVTAAFWSFPPDLRFPEPRPEINASRPVPIEAPVESAPPRAPVPSPPPDEVPLRETKYDPPVPAVSNDDEMWQRLPATLSPAIREKIPEASLSDEDIRELTETLGALRESMQSLRELERTPENAERIGELMGRIEAERGRFEKTAGMGIAEFVRRTTTGGSDHADRDEGTWIPETPEASGR